MKDEHEQFEKKEKYFNEKKNLIEQRILLLKNNISNDELKDNSSKLEILELEASLEGIIEYWKYYLDRLQKIKQKQEILTKECELNYNSYSSILKSIPQSFIKQSSPQIQEQYNKLLFIIDKWEGQKQKNFMYSLMKEVLMRMKKI